MKAIGLIFLIFYCLPSIAQTKAKKKEPIAAIALITYFDVEKGEVFNWWAEQTSDDLGQISRVMNAWLERAVEEFTFINPNKTSMQVPERFRVTNQPLTQLIEIAKIYQAKILVQGDVKFKRSPLLPEGVRVQINLRAHHVFNGQVIGEVLRISDVSTEQIEKISRKMDNVVVEGFKELAKDMELAHQRGIGQSLVLVISGDLNQGQLERLKHHIRTLIPEVKNITESSFDLGLAKYKIDYSGAGTEGLRKALQSFRSSEFLTQVVTAKVGEIQLDVKPF